MTVPFGHTHDINLETSVWESLISWTGLLIDMEIKGYETVTFCGHGGAGWIVTTMTSDVDKSNPIKWAYPPPPPPPPRAPKMQIIAF